MQPTTETFCVSRGKMAFLLFADNGKRFFLLFAAIIVAALIMTLISNDFRWCIVALMVVFIVIPMMGALFYIDKGFKPITAMNSIRHSLVLNDSYVVILNRIPVYDEGEQPAERTSEFHVPYSEFHSWSSGISEIIFRIGKNGKKGMLIVPDFAFNDSDHFKMFIDAFIQKIRQSH